MRPIVLAAVLLAALAPAVQAAPSDPQQPHECLGEPDTANCLGSAAKCVVRENVRFLYQCWGILGP